MMDMPSGQVLYYSAFEGALGLEDEGLCFFGLKVYLVFFVIGEALLMLK